MDDIESRDGKKSKQANTFHVAGFVKGRDFLKIKNMARMHE